MAATFADAHANTGTVVNGNGQASTTVRSLAGSLLNEPLRLLDDGILTTWKPSSEYMVYLIPARAVKKPYGLRELKSQAYDYEVPKNHVIARTVDKLADAGSVTVMRLQPATIDEMTKLYNGFVEKGLRVKPLVAKRSRLTLESLVEPTEE